MIDDNKVELEEALMSELAHRIAEDALIEREWMVKDYGDYVDAHCPICNFAPREDEYTGKPMISRHCPRCGVKLKEVKL